MGKGSLVRQWTASLAGSLSVSMSGAMFVWMAPLMVRFVGPNSPIPMTTYDTSWLNAVIEISEGLFTIPAGLLADRWGRKTVILAGGPLVLFSWIIILFTKSITAIYLVRLIQGIAMAIVFTVTPIYLAEIAEPNLRGQFGGFFQIFWYLGIAYSYVAGPYLSYENYNYLQCLPPILFIICFALVPESPYYLLMVKKEDQALQVLSYLRGDGDVEKEFTEIKGNVQEDMRNRGSWRDLVATKKDRMALLIVQIVCITKYLNGMSSIVVYASQTFAKSNIISLNSDQMSIVLSLILVIATMGSSVLADSVGRRPLLILSTVGGTIFHTIVAIYYYLDQYTTVDVTSYMWISYVSLIGFCIISNVGLGPLLMTIQAEYFPSHTRAKGGGITGVVASLGSFLSIKQYQTVDDYFGMYMNYVIFALISLAGAIIFWAVLHETAGKSLGQIQKSFSAATSKQEDNQIA